VRFLLLRQSVRTLFTLFCNEGTKIKTLQGPERSVLCADISPNNRFISAASADACVYVWTNDGGRIAVLFPLSHIAIFIWLTWWQHAHSTNLLVIAVQWRQPIFLWIRVISFRVLKIDVLKSGISTKGPVRTRPFMSTCENKH
jgi:WD40 repeat protein